MEEKIVKEKKEEKKVYNSTLTKNLAMMYSVRLGKILFNLSIVCLILCGATLATALATGVIFIFGLIFIILSLGTVFVYFPNYFDALLSSGDFFAKISSFLLQAFPYLIAIGIIGAIASIVFLALDKNEKHVARITIASIILALSVVIVIVSLVQSGGAA